MAQRRASKASLVSLYGPNWKRTPLTALAKGAKGSTGLYSLWSLFISRSAVGLFLATSFTFSFGFGLLALEGASLVYSGLGHFVAIGRFLGAPTVSFLAIACMGLADSLTVSAVTVTGAEGAMFVGRVLSHAILKRAPERGPCEWQRGWCSGLGWICGYRIK